MDERVKRYECIKIGYFVFFRGSKFPFPTFFVGVKWSAFVVGVP